MCHGVILTFFGRFTALTVRSMPKRICTARCSKTTFLPAYSAYGALTVM